ncbi:Protein of unknown function (DUF3558) [Actinokineospora globicatena]|nr:Protein of unknown function (DUF3558) [Actinokineospora globicatena]GLW76822.1 hypothetical protein Aglo01_13040 [Actinokineospora globicatena]GLW83655.1 hypothetical protein Aglo02_12950 [Actinokineospora globicatena]
MVFVAVLALVASACTSEQTGSPIPSGGGGTAPTTTSTRAPKTTTTAPVPALKPCALLSSSAAKSLGVTSGPDEVDLGKKRPYCEWRVDKGSIADSYTLAVYIVTDGGLADIVAEGEIEPIKVGSRSAAQSIGPGGLVCAISLELSEKTRVDVQAGGGDGQKLCATALDAAKLVEPELP